MSKPLTVVAIVAAYNEEDVIGQAVRALIEEGVQVYFVDHHSTDKTVAQVEPFRGRGVIGIETFPADGVADEGVDSFAWERILRRKEELAQTLDADWFIHHDADEFRESPWSGETLREGIQRVDAAGYNAIDFQVLNFSPTTADRADSDDIRERLLFYEPGRVFDRQQIKCWKRTGQPVVLTASGGHSAQFPDRRVFPIRFLLRHYPIRSQAHGERKVFQERLPRFAPSERARGWHVQYNGLAEGALFVRDPTGLHRYDPEAVRLALFWRHREMERLEGVAAASQEVANRLTAEEAALRRRLLTQDAELERLLSDLDVVRVQLSARDTTIAELLASRGELLASRDELLASHDKLMATYADLLASHVELSASRTELLALRDQLLASRSWKLTAPLRAADRLFRRRSPEAGPGRSAGKDSHMRTTAGSLAILTLDGALRLTGEVDGFWRDRWAGSDLKFRATVVRPMGRLRVAGLVPAELTDGQDLTLTIGDRAWAYHASPGRFEWSVPVSLQPTEHQFQIAAARSWRPSASGASNDDRDLAWHVAEIDGR